MLISIIMNLQNSVLSIFEKHRNFFYTNITVLCVILCFINVLNSLLHWLNESHYFLQT